LTSASVIYLVNRALMNVALDQRAVQVDHAALANVTAKG